MANSENRSEILLISSMKRASFERLSTTLHLSFSILEAKSRSLYLPVCGFSICFSFYNNLKHCWKHFLAATVPFLQPDRSLLTNSIIVVEE